LVSQTPSHSAWKFECVEAIEISTAKSTFCAVGQCCHEKCIGWPEHERAFARGELNSFGDGR
jgi:hypothetical protein